MSIKTTDCDKRVIRAFSEHSGSYSAYAAFQKIAAEYLSEWLPDTVTGRILEAGAGTGFFTRYLTNSYSDVPVLVTDASEQMLLVCKKELGYYYPDSVYLNNHNQINSFIGNCNSTNSLITNGLINTTKNNSTIDQRNISFGVYNPEKEGPYPVAHDLVVSALTAQWFNNFDRGISALADSVSKNGCILFSYLTNDSFPEWEKHCDELNIPFTANKLPRTGSGLDSLKSRNFDVKGDNILIKVEYDSALDFFRSLKLTGASTQLEGFRNKPSVLKRLMLHMDQAPSRLRNNNKISVEYSLDIVTGLRLS